MKKRRLKTYSEFWPHYLREHRSRRTRAIHAVGTSLAALSIAVWYLTGWLWPLPAALILGYGPAWFAHFFIEKNHPATFRYPIWSLISDIRMTVLWLAGKLHFELVSAGVRV